ncbi:MAG: SRPBCC domain-containing protein [Saprospiraceae bacterium]
MSKLMIIEEEVLFQANVEKVWNLLINPEMTVQYMFGCAIVSDWKIGSPVHWNGQTAEGATIVYVTGTVLEYEEGKKLSTTTFDPNSGMADIPANHINLTYELSSVVEGTLLKITQGDFSQGEAGEKRYTESKSGWKEIVIPTMKKLLP